MKVGTVDPSAFAINGFTVAAYCVSRCEKYRVAYFSTPDKKFVAPMYFHDSDVFVLVDAPNESYEFVPYGSPRVTAMFHPTVIHDELAMQEGLQNFVGFIATH